MNTSDILIDTLLQWDVNTVFGLPGDGINGIMEALRQRQKDIKFIQVRHEEAAAFMACAYAKFTRRLGVCLATSGPGGIHLLNGLYDAKCDGASVLAITGLHHHDLLCTYSQQDIELDKLFMDVAAYNARVMGPEHVESVANLACRTALNYRTVAHITIPTDVQTFSKGGRSARNTKHHTSTHFAASAAVPDAEEVRRASEVLNASAAFSNSAVAWRAPAPARIATLTLSRTSWASDYAMTQSSVAIQGRSPPGGRVTYRSSAVRCTD
jgi:pyruvate dehydrogenase (quinone)